MYEEIPTRPVEILLAEDSPADVRLTEEALKNGKIRNNLHVAKNGEEAMAFLRRTSPFEKAVRPDLILLDLNMPRKDGREVLEEVKSDPDLKSIPVVVMTTSSEDKDIRHAYEHQANCFVTKPLDFEQFEKIVKTIKDFWFTIVKLPGR